MGQIGFTAYSGLMDIGQPKPGQTLVVFAAQITHWLTEGKLKYRMDLVEGLRSAITALNKLFDGANIGKLMAKTSDEPA